MRKWLLAAVAALSGASAEAAICDWLEESMPRVEYTAEAGNAELPESVGVLGFPVHEQEAVSLADLFPFGSGYRMLDSYRQRVASGYRVAGFDLRGIRLDCAGRRVVQRCADVHARSATDQFGRGFASVQHMENRERGSAIGPYIFGGDEQISPLDLPTQEHRAPSENSAQRSCESGYTREELALIEYARTKQCRINNPGYSAIVGKAIIWNEPCNNLLLEIRIAERWRAFKCWLGW